MNNTKQAAMDTKGDVSGLAGKYLTFRLNSEEFGLEIMKVREIIGYMKITPVPQAPAYVKGMINLRGAVIPIIDLRLRFDIEEAPVTDQTCIIVVEIEHNQTRFMTGLVVDNVSEVHDIEENQIETMQKLDTFFHTDFILGICKIGNSVKILLDINKIIETSNIDQLV